MNLGFYLFIYYITYWFYFVTVGVEVNLSPFPNKLIRHQYLEIRAREAPTCCIFQVLETLQAQLHTPLTPPLIEYNNICGGYY